MRWREQVAFNSLRINYDVVALESNAIQNDFKRFVNDAFFKWLMGKQDDLFICIFCTHTHTHTLSNDGFVKECLSVELDLKCYFAGDDLNLPQYAYRIPHTVYSTNNETIFIHESE